MDPLTASTKDLGGRDPALRLRIAAALITNAQEFLAGGLEFGSRGEKNHGFGFDFGFGFWFERVVLS